MSATTPPTSSPRRIAPLQLDSRHADVPHNVDTVLRLVTDLLESKHNQPIDLLVLPELALTGYVFESKDEIRPLLEDAASFSPPPAIGASKQDFISQCRSACKAAQQPSLTLASHLARQLRCHVVIGFPELSSHSSDTVNSTGSIQSPFDARPADLISPNEKAATNGAEAQAFNSAALLSPKGSIVKVFRKHFLYETDEVWATEGRGFEAVHLPHLGTVCVAICMDLNPYRFKAPFEAFELANFCLSQDVDLLVMPMAWLLPTEEKAGGDKEVRADRPSMGTINYWAMRCYPFVNGDKASGENKMRYLVTSNRSGIEGGCTFGGSSCVLRLQQGERPVLFEALGSNEERCLVVTLPP